MKEIFDDYINNAYVDYSQSLDKCLEIEKNYVKYFPSDKKSLVLDIGIGKGEMLTTFAEKGYEKYYGIDISPSTINYCQSIGLNCELVENTEAWLTDRKNHFSLITLLDVLEHIKRENSIEFLESINSALTNDGLLLLQVPNLQSPDGFLHHFNDITHVSGYIEHSLRQILIASGFNEIEFFGLEPVDYTKWGEIKRVFLRRIYWKCVRIVRKINNNLNPTILNPVLCARAKRSSNKENLLR